MWSSSTHSNSMLAPFSVISAADIVGLAIHEFLARLNGVKDHCVKLSARPKSTNRSHQPLSMRSTGFANWFKIIRGATRLKILSTLAKGPGGFRDDRLPIPAALC